MTCLVVLVLVFVAVLAESLSSDSTSSLTLKTRSIDTAAEHWFDIADNDNRKTLDGESISNRFCAYDGENCNWKDYGSVISPFSLLFFFPLFSACGSTTAVSCATSAAWGGGRSYSIGRHVYILAGAMLPLLFA
jgi:hypothetical protein